MCLFVFQTNYYNLISVIQLSLMKKRKDRNIKNIVRIFVLSVGNRRRHCFIKIDLFLMRVTNQNFLALSCDL